MRNAVVCGLCLMLAATSGQGGEQGDEEPSFREVLSRIAAKSPAESWECLRPRSGFQVELVCAEPLVADPIAIAWDADGRLWVVEMGDYPLGDSQGEGARGRIRYLEDTNADGAYDSSVVFLDDLAFPTGVLPYRNGVLITCAPDILYAEDTNGDGRADRREVLYRGFVEGNPQHRVNALTWGVDTWIYGANGDSGGTVTSVKTGVQVDIHGRDFRIRPDSGAFETQSGMSQYGRCRDEWGNWFGGRNLQPLWHCALEDHYLRRNPFFVPPHPCVDLLDPPTCPPVFPISETLPRFNEFWTFNRITSACGPDIYRDNLFGPQFAHSAFICEPTHNLVHHTVLHPRGATFIARRPAEEQESEFLASSDHWFRPVQVRTGPDGALWIVDMYRLVIEHPDYIPPRWHNQLDFSAGRGLGRIYRVYPTGAEPRGYRGIRKLPTDELVSRLDGPNGPCRDLVQQLLIERHDARAVGPLRRLAVEGTRPAGRLAALCTLDALQQLETDDLVRGMRDPHPGPRRHAVRLAESRLTDEPLLQQAVLALLRDADSHVRMQLAYSLGEWDDQRAAEALAVLAGEHADDPLMIAAVISSAATRADEILLRLLRSGRPAENHMSLIENLFRLVFEAEQIEALAVGVAAVASSPGGPYEGWQYRIIGSLVEVIEYRGGTWRTWYEENPPPMQRAMELASGLFVAAERDTFDDAVRLETRVAAARLVGRGLAADVAATQRLAELLVPQTPVELQLAALAVLDMLWPDKLCETLLEQWSQLGPEIRPRVLDMLLREEGATLQLLDQVASGGILANELGLTTRGRLLLHPSVRVREAAARVLNPPSPAQRLAAIERFRGRLSEAADPVRGRAVYRQHCALCHRLEGEGTDIGPDLLALVDRSPESLLVAILDPNRAVEPRYVEYSAVTMQGRVYTGIVAAEAGNSITLIDAQGTHHALLRSDLEELTSTGQSLMPVGLEDLLGEPEELLDLIAYLRTVEGDAASAR